MGDAERATPAAMTEGEILALPAVVDLMTAARALGLTRNVAYDLAKTGRFPCEVMRFGSQYRVARRELCRKLSIELAPVPPATAEVA